MTKGRTNLHTTAANQPRLVATLLILLCLVLLLMAGCTTELKWCNEDTYLAEYTSFEYGYSLLYPERCLYICTDEHGGVIITIEDTPIGVTEISVKVYEIEKWDIGKLYDSEKACLERGYSCWDLDETDCKIDLDTGHHYKDFYQIRYAADYHGMEIEKNWWTGEPTGIKVAVVPIKGEFQWIQKGDYIYQLHCRTHLKIWEGSDRCYFMWDDIGMEFYRQFELPLE